MNPARFALLGAVLIVSALAACGSDSAAPTDAGGPATPTPSPSAPPSSTATAPTTPSDAGRDASIALGDAPARCGATPYTWVKSSALGDVLETKAETSHTPVELNAALVEARSTLVKTRRLATWSTRSKVIRYQTQDRGVLVDATGLMAMPDVAANHTFPIMLILHGTAGFNDACSPSAGVVDDALDGFADTTSILASVFASFGYVTIAPDYIGLKSLGPPTGFMHPYLVAEATAIASIDAVRAVKKQLVGSTITPGDIVVVGGSQGGHAAAFVNRYLPHYAPELSIKGSVWDVPPTDLLDEAPPALATFEDATKNLVAAFTAYDSWYKVAPRLGGALLPPYDTQVPALLMNGCSFGSFVNGATLATVFQPTFLAAGPQPDFGNLDPWACYLSENSLPTTSVPHLDNIPSMFLLGGADELVNTPVERVAFQTLCAQGHTLSFLECAGSSHTATLTYAFDQWLDFLEDRLANKPLTDVCVLKPAEVCTSMP